MTFYLIVVYACTLNHAQSVNACIYSNLIWHFVDCELQWVWFTTCDELLMTVVHIVQAPSVV